MEPVKCDKCGKEFRSAHGLKVHLGIQHGGKARGRRRGTKVGRRGRRRRGAPTGRFVCAVCGRTFRMAMHLARHTGSAHPRRGRPPKVGVRRARRAAAEVIDVRSLTVDQLLGLKSDVDARLADIVRQMRMAKVRV